MPLTADRACRPSLEEPNLALNLEICDYVNAKQGLMPREAAIAVVKLINQRDPQTLELALHLLDNLVKNCGYPFQLQILRKEFLNELVKKFPERPTLRYNRVQRLILAQMEEWYQTICKTSKYKDDFGYIRDMHRLLQNKGYVFPEVKVEDAAVLNPLENLKLLEEMQREEAIVHSAKLQELIRRGKPQDLQEANRLMKVMAGFKEDNIQENKRQLSDDVARLRRKTDIFAEMLNQAQLLGLPVNDLETLVDLYGQIKSLQPIVGKILEEEGSEEYVLELLALNDLINQVVEKYALLKGGDAEGALKIHVSGGAAGALAAKELNLIDFDEPEDQETGYNDLLSDLSNLNFNDSLYGHGGLISLGAEALGTPQGGSQSPSVASQAQASQQLDLLLGLNTQAASLALAPPAPPKQIAPPKQNAAPNQNAAGLDPFALAFPTTTPPHVSAARTKTIHQGTALIEADEHADLTPQRFHGTFYVSNTQGSTLSLVRLYVAVPKSCVLDLKPQSGDAVHGFAQRGFSQEFYIDNTAAKQLKVKWKLEYSLGGAAHEDTGVSVLTE